MTHSLYRQAEGLEIAADQSAIAEGHQRVFVDGDAEEEFILFDEKQHFLGQRSPAVNQEIGDQRGGVEAVEALERDLQTDEKVGALVTKVDDRRWEAQFLAESPGIVTNAARRLR